MSLSAWSSTETALAVMLDHAQQASFWGTAPSHWSSVVYTYALLTQRTRLYRFNSFDAYLMGDDTQMYRRRKKNMSFMG